MIMSSANPSFGALHGKTSSLLESSPVLEQAKKRHAEGQMFGNGALECVPSEEEVFAELVEDAPSTMSRTMKKASSMKMLR